MKLSLGVFDIVYTHAPKEAKKVVKLLRGKKARVKAKAAAKPSSDEGKTTGDVAEILEAKYHIMENFAHRYNDVIVGEVEKALAGQFENMIVQKTPTRVIEYEEANSAIEHAFRNFLDAGELDGLPGVPTMAALRGVSHRFLHPFAKRPERVSFVDTGQYQAAFSAQIKED